MLFQVLGPLLGRAGAGMAAAFDDDDHGDLQRRRVALLLTRFARFYPELFAALGRENQILGALDVDLATTLLDHGVTVDPVPDGDDPLARNRALHAHLDEIATRLHAERAGWATGARATLRRGLLDAARAQAALIAHAFAEPSPAEAVRA